MTANGDGQTNEEATVYVNDLDLFVTAQIFEDTAAVLSLGNSAKILDISSLLKMHCNLENYVACRCSGLVNRTFQLDYEYIAEHRYRRT